MDNWEIMNHEKRFLSPLLTFLKSINLYYYCRKNEIFFFGIYIYDEIKNPYNIEISWYKQAFDLYAIINIL